MEIFQRSYNQSFLNILQATKKTSSSDIQRKVYLCSIWMDQRLFWKLISGVFKKFHTLKEKIKFVICLRQIAIVLCPKTAKSHP
jgi:hypothetical protein